MPIMQNINSINTNCDLHKVSLQVPQRMHTNIKQRAIILGRCKMALPIMY